MLCYISQSIVLVVSLFVCCCSSLAISGFEKALLRRNDISSLIETEKKHSILAINATSILKDKLSIYSFEESNRYYVKPTLHADFTVLNNNKIHIKNYLHSLSSKHLQNQINASFSCHSLISQFDPTTLCSGIVDYSFIVPSGSSLADLNKAAISSVESLNSFMPTSCLSDLKRLTCASIYLKCVENVIPDDFATYALTTVSSSSNIQIPLPYVKPCMSLCTAVTYMGKSCAGLLEALQAAPDCLETTPVIHYNASTYQISQISLEYFSSTNDGSCNTMASSASIPLVASPTEPYIGSMCKGLFSEILTPTASAVDKSFAPLQPPFVLQTIQEAVLTSVESYIPRYLTTECLQAQRQVMCSVFFQAPFASNDLSFLFGTVYIPSFPNRKVCQKYAESCPSLIAASPAAAINCSGTIPGTSIELFPTANQTIVSLPLGYFTVNLISPPHTIIPSSSYIEITPECPYGFVIPEDTSKSTIVWATGTACAFACPAPFKTSAEYLNGYIQSEIEKWITFVFSILQLINIYVLKPNKRNIFIFIIISLNLILVSFAILRNLISTSLSDQICDSNASWYTYAGRFDSVNSFMCTLTGVAYMVQIFFFYWCLLALSLEIWIRVVWSIKDVKPYKKYYFWGTLLIAFGNIMVVLFYGHNSNVTTPGTPINQCYWAASDMNTILYTQTIPLFIYFGIAFVLFFHSLFYILKTSLKVAGSNYFQTFQKIWKSYGMLFSFMSVYLVVYLPTLLITLLDSTINFDPFVKSSGDWITCLISNFRTSSDNSYLNKCGMTPALRAPQSNDIYLSVSLYFLCIAVFYLTMNNDVKAFWWNLVIRVLEVTGISKLITMLVSKDESKFSLKAVRRSRGSVVAVNSDDFDSENGSTISQKAVFKRSGTEIDNDDTSMDSTVKENKQDVVIAVV